MSPLRPRAGCLGLLLLLAACSARSAAEPASCPSARVLDGAGALTRFAPNAPPAPASVALEAEIVGATATCRVGDGRGYVDMTLRFRAGRGPASQAASDRFTYFVAISDPNNRVLAREAFDVTLDFSRGTEQMVTEELSQTIPLASGAALADYRIHVGLQLTEEQLEHNRRVLGR